MSHIQFVPQSKPEIISTTYDRLPLRNSGIWNAKILLMQGRAFKLKAGLVVMTLLYGTSVNAAIRWVLETPAQNKQVAFSETLEKSFSKFLKDLRGWTQHETEKKLQIKPRKK